MASSDSSTTASQALFQPMQIGSIKLGHRVVMAPMTRIRASDDHVPTDMMVEYYRQRAATPGTLLFTDATIVSERAHGMINVPGIYNAEQIAGWKRVTEAVHEQGSFIYMQLGSLGRVADPKFLQEKFGLDVIAPSAIPASSDGVVPRELKREEIAQLVQDHKQAALNAMEAGFDGVELHNANGYLVNTFLDELSNQRTDDYGGSIPNRARFSLEILAAMTEAIGPEKVGIRLSPWSTFQAVGMKNPEPQYTYLVKKIATRWPHMAYVHAVESRVDGNEDQDDKPGQTIDFLHEAWGLDRPFLRAGGYMKENALETAQKHPNTAIVMGRYFISNPDLPRRWQQNVGLEPYDRNLFYVPHQEQGYTTYQAATKAN